MTPTYNLTASWPAIAGAVEYQVQRSYDNVTYAVIATTTALSYVDQTVPLVNLWYRIAALNSVGSTLSFPSQWSVPETTGSPKLANLDFQCTISVTLAWTPVTFPVAGVGGGGPAVQIVQRSDDGLNWYAVSGSLAPTVSTFEDMTTSVVQVLITYSASAGAVQYQIERSTDGITWTGFATNPAGQLSQLDFAAPQNVLVHYRIIAQNSVGDTISPSAGIYTVSPQTLQACRQYGYRILARNSAGDSLGEPTFITTNPPVLQITFSPTEKPLAIGVSWRALAQGVLAPGYYELLKGTAANTLAFFHNLVGTTYVDTDVQPGTAYFYQVRALTNTFPIYSCQGPTAGIIAPGPAIPNAPTVVRDPLLPWVDAFWLPSYGALTYALQRSADSGASWQTLATALYGCFYVDVGPFALNTTYEYRLVASDTLYSATGPAASIDLWMTPPSPALTLVASGVQLDWSGPRTNDLDDHEVQRSLDNLNWTTLATVNSLTGIYTYTDTAVTLYQRYYYRINLLSGGVSGRAQFGFSDSVVFKPPGSAAGFRVVVGGQDLSAIVERGSLLRVTDQISAKGAVATFRLHYDGASSPPVILTR